MHDPQVDVLPTRYQILILRCACNLFLHTTPKAAYGPVPSQRAYTQHDRQHLFALQGFNVPFESVAKANMEQSLTLRIHGALVLGEGEKKTTRMLNVFELCFVALRTG